MDKWILPVIDSMTASMIGDIQPYKHMNGLSWQDMPEELYNHRQVMKSVEWCFQNDIKPLPETIISHMQSEGLEDSEPFVTSLLHLRDGNQEEQLRSTSLVVQNWLKGFQADRAWEEATKVWNSSGTYSEKVDAIEAVLQSVRPDAERVYQYSQEELYEEFLEEMRLLWRNRQEKGEVGPMLPYEAADAYFSRFKFGEISSFIAKTGEGKTMFAMDIAEYIAWYQEFECDVVVLLLETDPVNIQKRQFAKRAKFPYAELESGNINVDDDYIDKFKEFHKEYIERNKTGRIHYAYIPQPTLRSITSIMEVYASIIQRTSERPVFFILDYLQKIQTTHFHEIQKKHEFYENCIEHIASKTRVLNKVTPCHTMIFAQENPDTGQTFGTKTLEQKSQMMFSLKRFEIATEENHDKPVMYRNKPVKDALGNDRYWHRKDGGLSSRAELHNIKSNDAEKFVIHLLIETPMGIITQNRSQLKELRAQGRLVTVRGEEKGKNEKSRHRGKQRFP